MLPPRYGLRSRLWNRFKSRTAWVDEGEHFSAPTGNSMNTWTLHESS